MAEPRAWIDLLDPDADALRPHLPSEITPRPLEQLAAPAVSGEVRPSAIGYEGFVFAVLLAPVAVPPEDRVYWQEIDMVVQHDRILTVRKTPAGGEPYDLAYVHDVLRARGPATPAMIAFHIFDDVAERYLDLVDTLDEEVDELEENVEAWAAERVRRRLTDLRHDMLTIRRTLAPTRDAARGIADGRVDATTGALRRREVFPRTIERRFADVNDKLLRATEGMEFARDLIGAVRDYHQAKVATEQNDVIKKLTVVASLLLLPTFIVGVYGQNFEHMPELRWKLGYAFSWGVVALSTIVQLAFFRWRRWI